MSQRVLFPELEVQKIEIILSTKDRDDVSDLMSDIIVEIYKSSKSKESANDK